MPKLRSILAAALMTVGLAVPAQAALAPAASACPAEFSFGVAGFGDGQSTLWNGRTDVQVHYSGWLNDMEGGVGALTRDVNAFRAHCPGTRLILVGHSQGAAIVHVYITRNPWLNGLATGVLYSDPKQLGTGESQHLFAIGGYPVAGTDDFFNGVPVTSLCHVRDTICNNPPGWDILGWNGYMREGAHGAYPFNAFRDYAWGNGVVWLP